MAQREGFHWDRDGLARLYAIGDAHTGEVVDDIGRTMKRLVPVDTGALRDSIEWITVDGRGVISVGTEYWEYVEFGTSKMAAQPFIRPALYRSR